MYQNLNDAYRGAPPNSYGVPNSYSPYPPPQAATSGSSYANNLPNSSSIMSQMNESSALELLKHLDKTDLQHLLNDDSKLKDLIDDLSQVKLLQSEHDDLIATNKSLAEYNLSQQPKMEDLKHEVASKYETANSLKTNLAESKARLDSFVGQQSLETLLALLQTETAKSEEESEQLADDFCGGQMSVEEFLAEYIPKRTRTHLRRIKSERFAELIRDAQHGPTASNNWSVPSHTPLPSYPHGHSAPYPTSAAMSMPQPGIFPR